MEPIAIIGIGCRLPGEAGSTEDIKTPAALWDFLQKKGHSYSDFPASRLNIDAWFHPDKSRPGSFYTRGGCFLKEDPRRFDPSFFGISPQETDTLDPSSRKLLETTYEAFESSGTSLQALSGSATGCFIGNFNSDHQMMQYRDTEYTRPYGMTGGDLSLLSNRISYLFNLHGPSLTVNTACSSSMYALHLACSSIQLGECDAAVVGGSNLLLSPDPQVFSAGLGGVSPSSCCHTFDAGADGYARAEGIGILYIKTLSKAIRDNDPIRAVIRGTAANANGRTGGITHPDPIAQERLIRDAYVRAGNLDPRDTYYLECHGTGTPAGDPLEVEAIGRVFGMHKSKDQPLLIGSIKTNIGHSEATSGISGIIKTVLAIEKGSIPPVRHLNKLNPNVNLLDGRIRVVQDTTDWPKGTFRRASVSSFGYGGANAHVILEELEQPSPRLCSTNFVTMARESTNTSATDPSSSDSEPDGRSTPGTSGTPTTPLSLDGAFSDAVDGISKQLGYAVDTSLERYLLLPFSAHDERTLRGNITAFHSQLGEWNPSDLAYTLGCRRSHLAYRSFLVASSSELDKGDISAATPVVVKSKSRDASRLGFIFTGQGSQWPQMGKELMHCFPVYLRSIRQMDKVLSQLSSPPEWTMEEALSAPPEVSRVYEASYSQTLVTALQVAIVDLLHSWNIHPIASVGHSSGEIAAAYAAGRVSASEAITIAYARGRAVSRNTPTGAMLAVAMSPETAGEFIASRKGVNVACQNSPESTTISGDYSSIIDLKTALDSEHVFARVVETGGKAYHSPHMKVVGGGYEEELDEMLRSLSPDHHASLRPSSKFFSSVTCSTDTKRPVRSSYWRQNLESPVLFKDALTQMISNCTVDCLIEIGPHAALRGPIRQTLNTVSEKTRPEYLPTLVRKENGAKSILQSAGSLWARGYKVNFASTNAAERLGLDAETIIPTSRPSRVITNLPTYRWQYGEINCFENRWAREWRFRTHPRHDILGSRQPGCNANEPMWRNVLKEDSLPWLKDHKIGPDTVFPAAAYVLMAIEAAMQMSEIKGAPRASFEAFVCEDLHLTSALIVPKGSEGVEVLFNLRRYRQEDGSFQPNRFEFTMTSVASSPLGDVFEEHAHGTITALAQRPERPYRSIASSPQHEKPVLPARWYDAFEQQGLHYGPSFRGNSSIVACGRGLYARSEIQALLSASSSNSHESEYAIHPATLDASIQLAIIAAHGGRFSELSSGFLPTSISKITVLPGNADKVSKKVRATSTSATGANRITSQICIDDASGHGLVSIEGLELVKQTIVPGIAQASQPFTRLEWRPIVSLLSNEDIGRLWALPIDMERQTGLQLLNELVVNQIFHLDSQHSDLLGHGSAPLNLQRLVSWIKLQLALSQQGLLTGSRDALKRSADERAQYMEQLQARLMVTNTTETQLLCHMYKSLPSILRGEISGIQAATQNDYLSDWYKRMALFREGSNVLSEVVDLLSFQTPRMSIFEIGGGTGSATRQVLRRLKGDESYRGYDTYTFTDIGPSFLAQAQTEFEKYGGMKYAPFDMEKPIHDQGFEPEYDLVIASNVIHVTTDIQKTLENVRRLLKPGGKLVLLEIVRPAPFWTMILGAFSDFWKGDHDPIWPRHEGPFLTEEMWRDILPRSGFSGLDLSLDHFTENGDAAVMVATAVEPSTAIPPSLPEDSVTIVYRESPSDFTIRVRDFYQSSGHAVELCALHTSRSFKEARVICLAEVDGPLFSDCSENEWAGVKAILSTSASTLWVTNGDLLHAGTPESTAISGLLSAFRAENHSARIVTLDLDTKAKADSSFVEHIYELERHASTLSPGNDFEFRTKDGIVHISRVVKVGCMEHDTNADKPTVDESLFDGEASYLLVDCFEELGQSLAHWMISRGAQRLVLLSSSHAQSHQAIKFTNSLKELYNDIQIIQANVTTDSDILQTVVAAAKSLKGIVCMPPTPVYASFEAVTFENFNQTFKHMVAILHDLHRASLGISLDFFLTISSWGSILGAASQASLQASSSFADAFSQFRKHHGLAATSLSLGQVLDIGKESRNLEHQEDMMRNGLYGNSEREFLQFCETVIRNADGSGQGHLLAGVEAQGLLANATRYPLESMAWHDDPRFAYLVQAVRHLKDDSSAKSTNSTLLLGDDDASEPLVVRIKKRIARSLYIAPDDIDQQQPIGTYGIDSLVAADIRGWLLRALAADVSTLKLLHPTMSVEKLAAEVEACRAA